MKMNLRRCVTAAAVAMMLMIGFRQARLTARVEERVVIKVKGTIASSILGEARGYSVYLPRSYDEGTKRYPLLVVLDGDDRSGELALPSREFCGFYRHQSQFVVG